MAAALGLGFVPSILSPLIPSTLGCSLQGLQFFQRLSAALQGLFSSLFHLGVILCLLWTKKPVLLWLFRTKKMHRGTPEMKASVLHIGFMDMLPILIARAFPMIQVKKDQRKINVLY